MIMGASHFLMSYQLPDLLTFLTSLPPSSCDGDLHINPSYTPNLLLTLPPKNPTLLHHLLLLPPNKTKTKKLLKTPRELIQEYNPGLLTCIFLPFTKSIVRAEGCENEEVVRVVGEWLSVCGLVGEDTVRPGRIVGMGDGVWFRECLEEIANRLPYNNQTNHNTIINEIINASNHPPPKPHLQSNNNNNNNITQYLNWRIDLSGHRVFSKLLLSPPNRHHHHHHYTRAIELAFQIIVCVTDLFAYNIHQAWHTTPDRNHLNLISFLLLLHGGGNGNGSGSETLTLQGAITMTGEMIRQRMIQLQTELYHTGNQQEENTLTNIFTSFFTAKNSPSPSSTTKDNDDNKTEILNEDEEIRKTIWNWVTGIIHWAYEVDYFSPDLEEDDGKKKKKKKGGEIRDYGWVFLIPKETL